jgi:proteasome assembly chaperone (PAC2) family protein
MNTMDFVAVDKGYAFMPSPLKSTFYYTKSPAMVIFEGEAQLPGQDGIRLLKKVIESAISFNVTRIYTCAALPASISHSDPVQLYGAANRKLLAPIFNKFGIRHMESGHISGLNGLTLGLARERNMDAACLLATIPQYAIALPNPKASIAVTALLGKILRFEIDLSELEEYAGTMEEKMAQIEEKVKDVLIIDSMHMDNNHEESKVFGIEKKVPLYIKEKIEKLFLETRQDRTKAVMLKKELDRWDLYKAYEDRFLDLFKNG